MKNWLERIKGVKKAYFHTNGPGSPCPDGTAAAVIVHDVLPKVEIVFVSHRDLDAIEVHPGALFVDICPPTSKLVEWLNAKALVLDHHDTRRHDVETFASQGYGYYGENAKLESGAMLALVHVWRVVRNVDYGTIGEAFAVLEFATLAAVRDTWQKEHSKWNRACEQAEMLRLYPWSVWLKSKGVFREDETGLSFVDEAMFIGCFLWERTRVAAQETAAKAMRAPTAASGARIAIINTTHTSDAAELIDADIVVGFQYYRDVKVSKNRLILSFRSRNGYDVGAIAQRLGGGGHKAAAGATVDSDGMNPIELISNLIYRHEAIIEQEKEAIRNGE